MEELSVVMLLACLLFSGLGVLFAMYGVSIAGFFLGGAFGCAIMSLIFSCFDD